MNLGYCCINLSLKDQGISTNRSMIKKTFQERGKNYAGQLALLNLKDLYAILKWNDSHNIKVYRMSSDIFPWMSEYSFEDLDNFDEISLLLHEIGQTIIQSGHRVGFHPGQFNVLPSPNKDIVKKTVYDLNQHAKIMDLMGLPKSHMFPINIHVGASYGDKKKALNSFCSNFELLEESAKLRLVVENDDKPSQYGVQDLYDGITKVIGCPITFDHFHHTFCTNGLSSRDAAELAASTWNGITPLQHFSSSKAAYEDSSVIDRSHADYIYDPIPSYGLDVHVELEAKAKDLALFKYLNDFI